MSKIIPTFVGERIALVTLRIPIDWDIRIRIRISSALSVTAREGVEPTRLLRGFFLSGLFCFLPKASEMLKGENRMS